jgi:hypothetical protein
MTFIKSLICLYTIVSGAFLKSSSSELCIDQSECLNVDISMCNQHTTARVVCLSCLNNNDLCNHCTDEQPTCQTVIGGDIARFNVNSEHILYLNNTGTNTGTNSGTLSLDPNNCNCNGSSNNCVWSIQTNTCINEHDYTYECGMGDISLSPENTIENGIVTLLFEYADIFDTIEISMGSCTSGLWEKQTLAQSQSNVGTWIFGRIPIILPTNVQQPISISNRWIRSDNNRLNDNKSICSTVKFMVSIDNLNAFCGFDIYSEKTTMTTLQGHINVKTTTNNINGRGYHYVQHETRGFTHNIILHNKIISINNMDVYGSVENYPSFEYKIFQSDTECVAITFTTQVQYPYELNNPIVTKPYGWEAPIVQLSNRCQFVRDGELCNQKWELLACQNAMCNDAIGLKLYLDATWIVTYTVFCIDSFTGGCSIPKPGISTISFDTASDNYCPRTIDTYPISSTLEAFSDPERLIPAIEFIIGSRTFFRSTVSTDACITNAHAECIVIISGGKTPEQLIYSNPLNVDISTYFSNKSSTSDFWANSMDSSSPYLINHDHPINECHEMHIDFDWEWTSDNSMAEGDTPIPTKIKMCGRVRYQEYNENSRRLLSKSYIKPYVHEISAIHTIMVSNLVKSLSPVATFSFILIFLLILLII